MAEVGVLSEAEIVDESQSAFTDGGQKAGILSGSSPYHCRLWPGMLRVARREQGQHEREDGQRARNPNPIRDGPGEPIETVPEI